MKKLVPAVFAGVILSLLTGPAWSSPAEGEFIVTGKELIERLTRLEEGQKALNQRIDDLRNLMYVLLGGMIALIGFVIWDRRSAISPVITKTRELEEREELTLRVLKEYAHKEPKMAEVLKSLGLLG